MIFFVVKTDAQPLMDFLVKFAKNTLLYGNFLVGTPQIWLVFIVEMTIIEKNEYLDYRLEEMSQPPDPVFC